MAQVPSLLPTQPSPQPQPPKPPPPPIKPAAPAATVHPANEDLPDAPRPNADVVAEARRSFEQTGDPSPSASTSAVPIWEADPPSPSAYRRMQLKRNQILTNQRFLNQEVSIPMTSRQKAFMAATDIIDPGNLAVVALSSGIYTAANAHSSYGPGFKGFGRNYGYTLSQDTTGEFFGTFAIPSLAHQDPRYHRMPGAPPGRRILHALAHTLVSQHDDGSPMPNYATLLTYPIAAATANLYVPGLQRDLPSTVKRVAIGLASDPADALIGEFLPDVARRIHIRVTFFQQVINDISTDRQL
jgi:hypothetical protein